VATVERGHGNNRDYAIGVCFPAENGTRSKRNFHRPQSNCGMALNSGLVPPRKNSGSAQKKLRQQNDVAPREVSVREFLVYSRQQEGMVKRVLVSCPSRMPNESSEPARLGTPAAAGSLEAFSRGRGTELG